MASDICIPQNLGVLSYHVRVFLYIIVCVNVSTCAWLHVWVLQLQVRMSAFVWGNVVSELTR